MFEKFKQFWNENGLEWLAIISVGIILILFIYNLFTRKRGTFSQYKGVDVFNFGTMPKDPFLNYRQHTHRDSKLELLTKYHLESIFNLPFYKIRPNFLRNEMTGRNLEIDLFNKDLGLAVEIQGIQHYKFNQRFHLSEAQFFEQQKRDEMKALKCRNYGIKLIEIPYYVKEHELKSFLIKKLKEVRVL
jgi:hypothetical protein